MAHPEAAEGRIIRHLGQAVIIPTSGMINEGGRFYFVIKSRGVFHVRHALSVGSLSGHDEKYAFLYFDYGETEDVYFPIHSSVTLADAEGGRYAKDDGEFWHIYHCSPKEQIDLAARIGQFAFNEFLQEAIFQNTKAAQAVTNNIVRSTAFTKALALNEFAQACRQAAYDSVIGETLGYFHRNPHEDHFRQRTIAAIDTVLAAWQTDSNKDLDRGRVLTEATAVKTRLSSTHKIQTWPEAREADRPKVKATIPNVRLVSRGSSNVLTMSLYFMDDDVLKYAAEIDDTDVATVAAYNVDPARASVVVTPIGIGSTTAKITATDPGGRTVEQSFTVTVVAA